jgi:hypothetical protein
MGQPAQAFEQQNHQAHLDTHKSLFLTSIVQENPQIQSIIISHCMQHLQFLSAQLAQEQIPEETQMRIAEVQGQMQQVSPQEAQQIGLQIQMILDQFSAPIMAQLTSDFLQSIGQGTSEDPLVEIRKTELALKDKELDMDASKFVAKQEQRAQEKLMDSDIQKRRLEVQKSIADDKLEVAIDRLRQNADLKLLEIESKLRR